MAIRENDNQDAFPAAAAERKFPIFLWRRSLKISSIRKFELIITLPAAFLYLGESTGLLRIESGKKFSGWTAVKEFETQRLYLRWCLPIKEGFLGLSRYETVAHEDDYLSHHQIFSYRIQ